MNKRGRSWIAWTLVFLTFTPTHLSAGEPFGGFFKSVSRVARGAHESVFERQKPDGCETQTVKELAGQLDWLEHHLDLYGSVVPKAPDVYGEARLTTHRQEVEKQLSDRLDKFGPTLQGAIRRADLSQLSATLSLSAASSSSGNSPIAEMMLSSGSNQTPGNATAIVTNTISPTLSQSQTQTQSQNQGSTGSGSSSFSNGVSLEPVRYNDQLFRYLNALNQIRRINEGDDTADGAGYSLNLIRVPVSVLPGYRTRTGYGSEVTFTAEPVLGDELLPDMFRDLVINDLVDLFALPIARTLGDKSEESLKRLLKVAAATREAGRLAELLENRIKDYEARSVEDPRYGRVAQFLRDDQEYLYQRFLLIAYGKIVAADPDDSEDANNEYPLTTFTLSSAEMDIELKLSATAEGMVAGIEDLLRHEVTVQTAKVDVKVSYQTDEQKNDEQCETRASNVICLGPYEVPLGITVHLKPDPHQPFEFDLNNQMLASENPQFDVKRRSLPLEAVLPFELGSVPKLVFS